MHYFSDRDHVLYIPYSEFLDYIKDNKEIVDDDQLFPQYIKH